MKGHKYQFTIEHLEDNKGNAIAASPLSFELRNNEDLFHIVSQMKGKLELSDDEATEFAIGLKLFGQVLINHRNHPTFKALKPHFTEFMKAVKNN
ncbi:DUF3861 domain-containing protein [Paraferrimonas haliotis]|uniref:DUF3861 family protein n=1 Tax=Paraferrimonas haliotis TaxID=2013866 RepID=A0AA37WYJ9_9GAMM|nr:DUF3861 domain-containing protein [Paraferrimonas haliotis]GLS84469.1 hypothetical protein GCM10007894_24460 [Paraferrimonas haliotis]